MRQRIPMEQRFWSKVNKTNGCWEWQAALDKDGYGRIGTPGKPSFSVKAHRYSWMLHFGDFDRRMLVCHHCDNPSCVRPEHLFLGTAKDNSQDMSRKQRGKGQSKESCVNGHPRDRANTYIRKDRDGRNRQCRACDAERKRLARSGKTSRSTNPSLRAANDTGTTGVTHATD